MSTKTCDVRWAMFITAVNKQSIATPRKSDSRREGRESGANVLSAECYFPIFNGQQCGQGNSSPVAGQI